MNANTKGSPAISRARSWFPLLGAGVNQCGRQAGSDFLRDTLLPNGRELAEYLAVRFKYPPSDPNRELQRISQYAAIDTCEGELYDVLHALFNKSYKATCIHRFLASVSRILREQGNPDGLPLIITTNYDDVLEDEFRRQGTPFDVVTYVRSRVVRDRGSEVKITGKFWHLSEAHKYPTGVKPPARDPARPVKLPEKHQFPVKERTVILKIHGAVDRATADRCSFVITEDDYIDYLATMDPTSPIPRELAEVISNSRFLFLGYALRDWNLRVVLQRIVSGRNLKWISWAIKQPRRVKPRTVEAAQDQVDEAREIVASEKASPETVEKLAEAQEVLNDAPGSPQATEDALEEVHEALATIEEKLWKNRDITLLHVELVEFIRDLETRLRANPQPVGHA